MVAGNGLDPIPEQRSELIGEGEIRKPFTVDAALALGDLQTHGSQQFAIPALGHLEFRDPFTQFLRTEMHRLPQAGQMGQIIQRGTPYAIIRRIHGGEA